MSTLIRGLSVGIASILLSMSSAWALGTLITADGTTVNASRTLVVRHADEIQIITQVKYGAATDSLIWLLAIPNFNRPEDDGVRANVFPSAALDELDALSRPRLTGACDDVANGMTQDILQAESFGPGLDMRPAIQYYSAAEITAGELGEYITGQGFMINDATQTMIDDVVNKNLMLVAVRVDVGALMVPRVDPIISLRYPAARDSRQGLPLQTLLPNLSGDNANLLIWVLDTNRAKFISRTVPLEFDDVQFISGNETNYLAAMDAQLAVHQTRMSVLEYAGTVDVASLQSPELATLIGDSGSSFLTRLRTRISPAAIRAETQAQGFISLRTDPGGDYGREHMVTGFGCQTEEADMGESMLADAGGEADGGMSPSADGGLGPILAMDGGADDGGMQTGGGSSGGCQVDSGQSHQPLFFLLILMGLYPLTHRRTRR